MNGRFIRIVNRSNASYNPQIAEVEAFEAPLPVIGFFTVDSGNITATGDPGLPTSAELSWEVSNAGTVEIDQGIGGVSLDGRQTVSPSATTTYVLTAGNASGTTTASVTVGVDEAIIPPVLTELMADNGAGLEDQFGEASDWIEIYNPNSFNLGLAGYHLSDDPVFLTRWTFPAGVSVPANGYLIVFASGQDLLDPAEPLHTNFSLKKGGESLLLVAPDGTTILTQYTFPAGRQDVSYGVEASGATTGFFSPSSPGAVNGSSFAGFVEDTKFSVPRGFYELPQSVAITTATPGAVIRYTIDGSAPTESHGSIYSGPVSISTTTTLRAMAYQAGLAPTNVDTNTYLFVDDVIASPDLNVAVTQQMRDSLLDVPSLSIVTPSSINGTSEVEVSFELIHPDGSPGFQENCGVKNFGGAFTNFDKKSFRMYFRSKYGASKLEFPLFEGFDRGITATDRFDQLNLRSGSHDMVSRGFYMSNRFTDDTMLDMGNINPHGRFMHLYLNGRYWGVYHIRERWSASTLSKYLGGSKDSYEAINGNWNVGGWADSVAPAYDGDGSAWARIKDLALTSDPDNFNELKPYLDIQNFVDYMIMWMYGNSEDEYRCVGPVEMGSGFKWFLNDADGYLRSVGSRTSFDSNTPGVFGRGPGDGPGSLFSLLFKAGNPEFRTLLADRIHKHYFNDGAMTPSQTIARLEERCAEIDSPFRAEAFRWNYRSHTSWTNAKNSALTGILPGRTASALSNFRSAGFYPATTAPVYSQHGGKVLPGFTLGMTGADGEVYYTIDGSDPRLVGGSLNPEALLFTGGEITTTVIPAGAEWKYLDDGSDQGTAWQMGSFDDEGWSSGSAILGYGEAGIVTTISYGENPSEKHTTSYFRKVINLAEAATILSSEILVKRDDGAVVYLNGTEVGRTSMPAGAIGFQTLANSASDDGSDFHSFNVPINLFVEGDNVIAVEVHQASLISSDLQFDLELKINTPSGASSPLTMTGNTLVRARALDGGNWSALNEAFFQVGVSAPVSPGSVVPSEIHYNPAGPDETEFIELYNPSAFAINLRGCFFSEGVEFHFPDNRDVVLAPGERVLLVGNQIGFDASYQIGLPIVGVFRGNLNNGGEQLTLLSEDGLTTLFSVNFDGADPWPEAADGDGHSLVLSDPTNPGSPASWRPSVALGGSPGVDDATRFSGDPFTDLDKDGVNAFAEYAMGSSDNIPNDQRDGPSFLIKADRHWTFTFPQALGADDVRAILEFSADLQSWNANPATAVLTLTELVEGRVMRTYTSAQPMDEEDMRFVRVRYTTASQE